MKKVSTARAKQLRGYAKLKREFLIHHTTCFVCGSYVTFQARELHHFYKRDGRLLTWTPGFRLACSECHLTIHRSPAKAFEMEWTGPKETLNDFDRAVKHHNQKDTK